MNERDEELIETLEALVQDLAQAGWHLAIAVASPNGRTTEMWLSTNPLITYSLAELLRDRAYDDLTTGVDEHDES